MAKKFDSRVFMAAIKRETGEKAGAAVNLREAVQLLGLENEAFIRAAYQMFFHREPDISGMATYVPHAATLGGRLKLLAVLYLAPERKYLPLWQRAAIEKTLWLIKFKWLK